MTFEFISKLKRFRLFNHWVKNDTQKLDTNVNLLYFLNTGSSV